MQKSGNPGRLKQSILADANVDEEDDAGVTGGEVVGDDEGAVDGAGAGAGAADDDAGAGTGAADDETGAGTGAGAADEDGAGAGAGAEDDEAGAGAGAGAWHDNVGLRLSQLCRVCSQTFCLYDSLELAR